MPEPQHDRLEEFFRKASLRTDVPFNEEDWKKLEARLDAAELTAATTSSAGRKISSAAAVAAILLLLTGGLWLNARYDGIEVRKTDTPTGLVMDENEPAPSATEPEELAASSSEMNSGKEEDAGNQDRQREAPVASQQLGTPSDHNAGAIRAAAGTDEGGSTIVDSGDKVEQANEAPPVNTANKVPGPSNESIGLNATRTVETEKVYRDLISNSSANAVKIKQRANVELPGAEEGDTGEADAPVAEEDASVKQGTKPRLSLLLSFAPDFSSTSNQYSAPGKAFGAVIHYHLMQRWSVSAGVIRNNKKYTGDGEDYQPPAGYWKYYTNGVIPYSIDGACSVLEFPVMLQYTIASTDRNRWLVGAGTSSYLMLNESYRYKFEEPNPGAKEGWTSKNSSRFYFNMINVTVGYEHQVLPGLMIGLEPYVKIPVEAIGWTNIKLFSTGASFTLRYRIVGRQNVTGVPTNSIRTLFPA